MAIKDQKDLLIYVLQQLEESKIPYMLTGGLAILYWGVPRATLDIDFVVVLQPQQVEQFAQKFKKDFGFSEDAIRDAIEHKSEFNLIHMETGSKVDVWIRQDTEYARIAFERRRKALLFGHLVFIVSLEDLILAKLLWYRESESSKHLEDIKTVLKVQSEKLDQSYLLEWITKLGLEREWEQASGNL